MNIMTNTSNELERMCKSIADELESIYSGALARELEEKIDALEESLGSLEGALEDAKDELAYIEDEYTATDRADAIADTEKRMANIEEQIDETSALIDELTSEKESLSFFDYFNDALDIEYTVGSDMQYRGVCIMVTCGGPNIYVDTTRGEVWGAWWGDKASAWLPREICDEIDSVFEELYQCAR